MPICLPKASGSKDHRDQQRQEGKCKNTPIQLVIALFETSGFFCIVSMMDGRHKPGIGSDCSPCVAFSWSLPHFQLTSFQQLLFAQFATPRATTRLQSPMLLKQTVPQDPSHANIPDRGFILQHQNRCRVRKILDLQLMISEPQSPFSSAHSSEQLFLP